MAQKKAVNYVFETPGGTIYHGAILTSQTTLQKHGKDFKIDVALNKYGRIQLVSKIKWLLDLLAWQKIHVQKSLFHTHYDIWSNLMASTNEIPRTLENKRKIAGAVWFPSIYLGSWW